MTLDTPVMRPAAPRSRRGRSWPFVGLGIVLGLVYSAAGTWSVGQGFGGVDSDGGWLDFNGRATSTAPLDVQVVGHPALWVYLVVGALLAATAVWAARGEPQRWRRRRRAIIGGAITAVFVVAVVLVFTVLQMQLVGDAFARGDTHPPILGNATVTTSRMTPG